MRSLLATAKLFELHKPSNASITKEKIIQHAIQICEEILKHRISFERESEIHGSLTNDYRTTPTATRLEGLLAALTFLPEEEKELIDQIKTAVQEGIIFLLHAQIKDGEYAGGITREILRSPKSQNSFDENNRGRKTEIRIDYVQHALSAVMQYQQLIPALD